MTATFSSLHTPLTLAQSTEASPMASSSSSSSSSISPLLFFARISGLAVAFLVASWALNFKSSFLPQSTSQEDLIYAVSTRMEAQKIPPLRFWRWCVLIPCLEQVLHPLLMVIGFILISGEGDVFSTDYYYCYNPRSSKCAPMGANFFLIFFNFESFLVGSQQFWCTSGYRVRGAWRNQCIWAFKGWHWLPGCLGFGRSSRGTMASWQISTASILGWVWSASPSLELR